MTRFSLKLPLALAVIGAAVFFSLTGSWPVPRWTGVATTSPIVVSNPFRVVTDTLHSGENVATLLGRQGVSGLNLNALAIALSFDPKKIRAGLVFSVRQDGVTGEANHVEFRPNPQERLQFIRTSTGWVGNSVPIRWTVDTARLAAGVIGSLYESFDRSAIETTLDLAERRDMANNFANLFEGSVDFYSDIQPNDQFAVLYERLTSEDGEARFSRILAASLITGGKELKAYHFIGEDGKHAYFDAAGKGSTGSFLLNPIEFKNRISSGFSRARFHPVLGRMRAHEGTDIAADRGTPVRTTANGVVTKAGYNGGYGNLVEIRHKDGITTRYGHLSSIGVRVGDRVSQGQMIGRVGSTGLATGPHLHYEYRVNGLARNAFDKNRPNLGTGDALPASRMPAYRADVALLQAMLYPRGTGPITAYAD